MTQTVTLNCKELLKGLKNLKSIIYLVKDNVVWWGQAEEIFLKNNLTIFSLKGKWKGDMQTHILIQILFFSNSGNKSTNPFRSNKKK